MWFRIFALLVTASSWGITLWLTGHQSENAEVFSRYSNEYFGLLILSFVISSSLTFVHFGASYQWIHSKRHNLILILVSSTVSLSLIELIIRSVDPIGISYYEHVKNYHLDKIADDETYYRHKPYHNQEYQGVSVQTNSIGMRDSPILEKEPTELRILFLGDSVTFGWGVKHEDIFVHRVGEILQKQLNRPVRTINTGVGSYNTVNEYATLKRYGEKLKPDLVILIYVSNDIDPLPGVVFDPLSGNSFAGKNPPEIVRMLLGASWTYRLTSHLSRIGTSAPGTGLSKTSAGWEQSVSALQGISTYCNSAEIPLLVLMYRMTPNRLENDIARELNLLSRESDFYFDDILPWFDGKDIRSLINSRVDSHPNAKGHAILTEGIVKILQENVLPERIDVDQ